MIEVVIEDEAWTAALPQAVALCEAVGQAVIDQQADVSEGADYEASVLLTGDEAVHDLNRRFRGKDSATNVLSFPAHETATGHLGDIALAYGVCAREAADQGKSLAAHMQHLVAHGVLHLVGYDHEADADAEVMEDLERRILARLGLPDPYA